MTLRTLLALAAVILSVSTARAGTVEPRGYPAQPYLLLPWWNGGVYSIGQNYNCVSSPPILEIRTQAYAGYSLIPPNFTPAVGEVFYTHLVLSHPGNPCTGSAIGLEMLLPQGVVPAPSTDNPVFCFAILPASQSFPNARLHNMALDPGYGCPQTFSNGLEGYRISAPLNGMGGGSWGMHRGFWLEFLIPLRATQPQAGNQAIRFRVNPDIGVVDYPQTPALSVNNEVIFRHSLEDNQLRLDICTISPTPVGC